MKKSVLTTVGSRLLIVVLVYGIIFAANSYHNNRVVLDGPSMEPTIHSGQTLKLKKYIGQDTPKRGDIVEYRSTNKLVQEHVSTGKLVHRVIALPGERISISNSKVMVFNTLKPDGFNPDANLAQSGVTSGNTDLTLAPGTYFVMGDNRTHALDSRTTGPVPFDNIIGKVTY